MNYIRETLPRVQAEYFERQRQTDKVIIWLTAISTASIALLIAKSNTLVITNEYYLKVTVAFLLLSIVSGAIYRAFLYPLEQLQSNMYLYIESYCYGATLEAKGPRKISDTDTIKDIAGYLKSDMGLDYDHWLAHNYLDRDFWIEHYNSWASFWEKSEEEGLKNLGKAVAPLSNKSTKEGEKLFLEPDDGSKNLRKYSMLLLICKMSYWSSLAFFSLAVISIGLGYIFE